MRAYCCRSFFILPADKRLASLPPVDNATVLPALLTAVENEESVLRYDNTYTNTPSFYDQTL